MASKSKSVFVCNNCEYEPAKWLGKCPDCGEWNTFEEQVRNIESNKNKSSFILKPKSITSYKLDEIKPDYELRYKTGMGELDRVLGGGIVKGSLVLLSGDPGIGKSTLLLQICSQLGKKLKILYVSGEESYSQIKLRADRLKVVTENLFILCETDVQAICEHINSASPDIVIVDSIQTMNFTELNSSPGCVTQVRESSNILMRTAKALSIPIIMVGHVNKDGNIAGPKVLEHIVDAVLYFEGERNLSFRILRAVKNRFGSTNEIGVFEMCDTGLREVKNPSMMLLDERNADVSGSAVVCTMEGSRGVMAEIQALVTPTGFGNPRRMANGIDMYRMMMLIAVLEKRARMNLSNSDVYLNVAGGLRIDETGVDLGICAAIATSQADITLPSDMIFIGEVGLGGELRGVSQLEKRLSEAAKLGFKSAFVPQRSLKGVKIPDGFAVYGIKTVSEMINMLRKK